MFRGQIFEARQQSLSPLIALFAAASLVVLGLALVKSPTDLVLLLAVALGVIVAFMRPDWFIYFCLFTLPIDFARTVRGFPVAIEESYVLALPFVVLHRWAGGKIVRRLKLHSAYLFPVLGIVLLTGLLYFRGQGFGDYVKTMGRLAEAISVAWAILSVATTWDRQRKMIYSFFGGALVNCVLIFIQMIARGPTWIYYFVRGTDPTAFSPGRVTHDYWVGRGTGFLGPSGIAIFMEVLLPLALYRLLSAKRKLWHFVVLALLWGGILLTFTLVPILVAVATSALLLLVMRKFNWKIILAIVLLAGTSIFMLSHSYLHRQLEGHLQAVRQTERYQRLTMIKLGWELFERHPIVGYGPAAGEWTMLRLGSFWSKHYALAGSHTVYLDLADEFGLLGLVCYGWIWFRALQLGYRSFRDRSLAQRRFEAVALGCAVVAALMQGFTDPALFNRERFALYALLECSYLLLRSDRKAALAAALNGAKTGLSNLQPVFRVATGMAPSRLRFGRGMASRSPARKAAPPDKQSV